MKEKRRKKGRKRREREGEKEEDIRWYTRNYLFIPHQSLFILFSDF
jgi:hypothetical protein